MGKRYNIAFKGEVAAGFDVDEVKTTFAERFRKSDSAVDRIFSGDPITLAKDLEWDRANTALIRLLEFGAVVYLIDPLESGVIGEGAKSANDSDVRAALDPNSSIYAKLPDFADTDVAIEEEALKRSTLTLGRLKIRFPWLVEISALTQQRTYHIHKRAITEAIAYRLAHKLAECEEKLAAYENAT